MTELSTSFDLKGSRGMVVFLALAVLGFFAMLYYAWYRNEVLDQQYELQQPVVQTCIHHRITQKVTVSP